MSSTLTKLRFLVLQMLALNFNIDSINKHEIIVMLIISFTTRYLPVFSSEMELNY